MFEDTKGIIRRPKSKDRQYNDQNQNNKMISNGPQDIKQKTKDQVMRNPTQFGGELGYSEMDNSS